VLVDPMPDLVNQAGTGVLQDPESLANGGAVAIGIAADGAARLVIRIYANSPGDHLTVALQGDGGANINGLPQPFGVLQTLLPIDGTVSGAQLTVTAVSTSAGPMAFAQYFPPSDFSRGGADDTAPSRPIAIMVQSVPTGIAFTQQGTLARPPVVLVHGLWGDPSDWATFTPFLSDGRFAIRISNYNFPVFVSGGNSNPSDYSRSLSE
jgi:hypothetical protein